MTRRTDTAVFGLKALGALLLLALGSSAVANAGPCVDSGQKPEARAPEAPAAKPVPVKPRGSRTPARPNQAKVPPGPEGELIPFFGPRGALAPHVV